MHGQVTEESSHLTAGENELENVEAPLGLTVSKFRAEFKAARGRRQTPYPLGPADASHVFPRPQELTETVILFNACGTGLQAMNTVQDLFFQHV